MMSLTAVSAEMVYVMSRVQIFLQDSSPRVLVNKVLVCSDRLGAYLGLEVNIKHGEMYRSLFYFINVREPV